MSDDRANVYFDPDINAWVYRASALGNCVRALVASAMEYDEAHSQQTAEMLQRTADEGNTHEKAMREKLVETGHVLAGEQQEVTIPIVKGKIYVRGHLDDIVLSGPLVTRPSIWEAKSLSVGAYKEWMAKGKDRKPKRFAVNQKKAYQISTYMHAYPDHDVLYQSKQRDGGIVDTLIIEAGNPPVPFKDVRKKILTADTWRRKGMLPPCDITNQWGCPFFYLHEEQVLEEDNASEEDTEALRELVRQHYEYRLVEKAGEEAEGKRKELAPEILGLMSGHKSRDIGDFKVSVVGPYEQSKTNWTAVEEEVGKTDWDAIDIPFPVALSAIIARHTTTYTVTYPKVTKK